jgi:hypothetical protein
VEDKQEYWIRAVGVVIVDEQQGRIALSAGFDIINYYSALLENSLKQRFSYPKHGAHVSIYLKKIHGNIDFKLARKFHKERVEFFYNPDIVVSPKNFWFKVKCKRAEEIKKELKIKDDARFMGLHLTLCNKKDGIRKYQPQMIVVGSK